MASFLTSMWMNEVLNSLTKLFQFPRVSGLSVRAFLVKVEAQVAADPSFMKDKVNFPLVIIVDGYVDHKV